MGVGGKRFKPWKDLSAQRQISQYNLVLYVLTGIGRKGGVRSVSNGRRGHKGITRGTMGRKGNKETFSPHSAGNVERIKAQFSKN
jgi:hypothetical protein